MADINGWTQIDEGTGNKYAHAQNYYLDKGLIDDNFKYNYKLVDNKLVELTEEEKTSLFPSTTNSEPSINDRISALESTISVLMGVYINMYNFIKDMWIMRRFTIANIINCVAKGYITQDQANEIESNEQIKI